MKFENDQRVWLDRVGVRMEEPRDRFWAGPEQVMTSVLYTGQHGDVLLRMRVLVEDYFAFCRDVREAIAAGRDVSEVRPPESLMALFEAPPQLTEVIQETQVSAVHEPTEELAESLDEAVNAYKAVYGGEDGEAPAAEEQPDPEEG